MRQKAEFTEISLEVSRKERSETDFVNPAYEPEPQSGEEARWGVGEWHRAQITGVSVTGGWSWGQGRGLPWHCLMVCAAVLTLTVGVTLTVFIIQFNLRAGVGAGEEGSGAVTGRDQTSPTARPSLGAEQLEPPTPSGASSTSPLCGGTLDSPQGSLSAPSPSPSSPPGGLRCVWWIEGGPGHVVQLKILALSGECPHSHLEITEELGDTHPPQYISRFCGSVSPLTVITNASRLRVSFLSEAGEPAPGFNAQYQLIPTGNMSCAGGEFLCDTGRCVPGRAHCDGHSNCTDTAAQKDCSQGQPGCEGLLTAPEGSLSSPHNPEPHPQGQRCLWRLWPPPGYGIRLLWLRLGGGGGPGCGFHFLEVHDVPSDKGGHLLGRLCEESLPPELMVVFMTDERPSNPGFQPEYHWLEPRQEPCGPGELLCDSGECVAGRWACDGWSDCEDGSDEVNCTGVTITPYETDCEVIELPMCLGLRYNQTLFPNLWLGIPDQRSAVSLLKDYTVLTQLLCYEDLRALACSIVAPMCTREGGLVPPCQAACRAAEERCQRPLTLLGILWPFNCHLFPDSQDPVVCLTP